MTPTTLTLTAAAATTTLTAAAATATTAAAADPLTLAELFSNYLYRTITLGTTLIGTCSAAIGCLLYLRKQSLTADVIGHAALPGVMAAFAIAAGIAGVDGRSLAVLTLGAFISALLAVLLSHWIATHTRLGPDAAMAICLALFYGLGITGLHLITHSTIPGRGGIKDYMFGNATGISATDVNTIAAVTALIALSLIGAWKRYKLSLFDPISAATTGWNPTVTVVFILVTATVSIIIGMKAVGLILMVAFSIIPAAAARQWATSLSQMIAIAALIGASSALAGTFIAIRIGNVPTGPVIVIVLSTILAASLLFAPRRSLLIRAWRRNRQRRIMAEAAARQSPTPRHPSRPHSHAHPTPRTQP